MKRNGLFWNTGLFAVLSLVWTWFAGKDLNWDFINYHFYGPYQLLNHRLGSDYFAGSLQSYLNPIGYLPLYWMITEGWQPVIIGAALAAVHSLNFALLWVITARILPRQIPHKSVACATAVFLAFLSPLQLTTLGGTFLDPITSLPVLAALCLLVQNASAIRPSHAAWMGFLMGVAAGLKLTNLLLLPACIVAIEAVSTFAITQALRRVLAFSVASFAGLIVTHGYWSFELWRELGNPLFPLLNNIFRSPDFPAFSFQDRRFLDRGLLPIVTLPVQMMDHLPWVYSENNAPDVRPFGLCVSLILLLCGRILLSKEKQSADLKSPSSLGFRGILVFVAAFYLIWASTSRIGRYAYILWVLVGPLTVASLARLPWTRLGQTLLLMIMAIQLTFQFTTGNPRWSPAEWGDEWLTVEVPEDLQKTPFAFITLGVLSYSAIIPFFHRDSQFSNAVGQHVQPVGEKMTPRFRKFISTNLSLKVVFPAKGITAGELPSALIQDANEILSAYGLGVEGGQCEFIRVKFGRQVGFSTFGGVKKAFKPDSLAVCDVVRRSDEITNAVLDRMRKIDQIFDDVEKACPNLLNPAGVQTMRGGKGWMRNYFNSNTQLMTDGNRIAIRPYNSINDIFLGTVTEWARTDSSPECPTALIDPF